MPILSQSRGHISVIRSIAYISSLVALTAHAQIGVSTCNCQPSVYTFVLDSSLGCSENELVTGPGISDNACLVQGEVEGTEVPTSWLDVEYQETTSDGTILRTQRFNGPFNSGDSIRYTAFASTNTSDVTSITNPFSLQATATGKNEINETLVGLWRVNFANDCTTYPVIADDTKTLWMILDNLGDPIPQFCPIAGLTNPPSSAPTKAPVSALPTVSPPGTGTPSQEPAHSATQMPTSSKKPGMKKKKSKTDKSEKMPKIMGKKGRSVKGGSSSSEEPSGKNKSSSSVEPSGKNQSSSSEEPSGKNKSSSSEEPSGKNKSSSSKRPKKQKSDKSSKQNKLMKSS